MSIDLGYRLSTFREPPGARIRSHAHGTWHLLFLIGGSFEEEDAGGTGVHVRAGEARLSPGGAPHNIDMGDAGAECAVIHLGQRYGGQLGVTARDHQFVLHPRFGAMAVKVLDAARTAVAAPWLAVASLLDLRRLLQLACRLRRHGEPSPVPQWLIDAHENIARGQRVDDVAAAACVSREHLARVCREHFGYAPLEARHIHALARAVELLCMTNSPLSEVALRSGFSDQSHFTNLCRARLGTTPARIRLEAGITNLQDARPRPS